MLAQTLQTLVGEVNGLWSWIIGIIAGWGLTFSLVIAVLAYAHIRIARLKKVLGKVENQLVTDVRDLSLRMRDLEK